MTENPGAGRIRPLLSGVVLRSQTDERLGALASAGNQQAFTVIFERYRRELRAHAGRIVRPDRADDVVQQAMLSAWTTLLAGTRVADLRAWLHRVVHNGALDMVARRGYDDIELHDSPSAPTLTEDLAEGRLKAEAALAALAALPESQLRALTLTAIEGRSGHDAAAAMGLSESAMRQLVYRARSGVRAAVTAITPLPLIGWLAGAGGVATPGAVGLAAAGGGAATAAKVIAVIGVTATIGVAVPFRAHHSHRPPRTATSTSQAEPLVSGAPPVLQQAAFGRQPQTSARAGVVAPSVVQLPAFARGQPPTFAQPEAASDPAVGAGRQPGSDGAPATAPAGAGDQRSDTAPAAAPANDPGAADQSGAQAARPRQDGGGGAQPSSGDSTGPTGPLRDGPSGGRADPGQSSSPAPLVSAPVPEP